MYKTSLHPYNTVIFSAKKKKLGRGGGGVSSGRATQALSRSIVIKSKLVYSGVQDQLSGA